MGLPFEPEPRDRLLFRRIDKKDKKGEPQSIGLIGELRRRCLELEQELLDELRDLDAEVQRLVDRRSEIAEGLRMCREALDGDMFRTWMKRRPWPAELAVEPEGTRVIRGEELRGAIRAVLEAAGRPMSVGDIHRGLLARGVRPGGRSSHAISNALAVEIRAGRATRDHRGVYRAA